MVESIKEEYTRAALTSRERAILDYAVKLTLAPSTMTAEDVAALHDHALTDRDILDVVLVACLFNYNDRVADATGISSRDFLEGLGSADPKVR